MTKRGLEMRYTKHLTQKEWNRFDWDKQELLCARYKIIIDDWLPKWTKRYNTLKKYINQENFDKGMDIFNNAVQDFGKSTNTITREMSTDIEKSNRESEAREKKNKENLDKIWGKRD